MHVLTLWVVIITQSSFTCVIIYQSPYREFYHTSRYPFAGILHNSRYYLRAHFGQIEIFSVYIICILYIRTDYSDASSCGGNNLLVCSIFMHCMHHVIKTHACQGPAFISYQGQQMLSGFLNNSNKKMLASLALDIAVIISSLIATLRFTFVDVFKISSSS